MRGEGQPAMDKMRIDAEVLKSCEEGAEEWNAFGGEGSRDSWAMGFGYGDCSGG